MSRSLKALTLSLLLAVATTAVAVPQAAREDQDNTDQGKKNYDGTPIRVKPAFPTLDLGRPSKGDDAVKLLGNRLPEVAAHFGKTPAELAKQLREDRTTRLDRHGRMFFMEELPGPPPPGYVDESLVTGPGNTAGSGAVYPLGQTFLLHSRPNSKRKIFLDFNGHTITGTAWNAAYGADPIIAQPYDTDGIPGTFSDAELTAIQNIWRRVSEDYAAFDVDVTTEEPTADQLTRYNASDDTYGTRAVITRNFTAAAGANCNCGGIAYVGVFDNVGTYYQPALIFFDMLGSNEKNIAEAASHEVGHTAGLSHDGDSGTAYYAGSGSLDTGWAPIMGVGYYRWLVQFSKGEYPGANNHEDDYAVMASNGVLVAPDDFGNTKASAAVLQPTTAGGINTSDALGVINSPTDVDMFKFHAGAGTVVVDARPFSKSPNLDILLNLRDAAGNIVATSNPPDALYGYISMTLPAGTYWASIQGTGKGTDYSSYGSIGRYSLRVTAPVPTGTIPVSNFTVSATSAPAGTAINFNGSSSTGTISVYEWNFADGSPVVYGQSVSHTYTSSGLHNASLRVTTTAGYSDIRAVSITIQ